jgi:hypothetical protein
MSNLSRAVISLPPLHAGEGWGGVVRACRNRDGFTPTQPSPTARRGGSKFRVAEVQRQSREKPLHHGVRVLPSSREHKVCFAHRPTRNEAVCLRALRNSYLSWQLSPTSTLAQCKRELVIRTQAMSRNFGIAGSREPSARRWRGYVTGTPAYRAIVARRLGKMGGRVEP